MTHLHSDHIADLYQLVWLSWAFPLQNPVDLYGPGRAGGLPQARTPGAVPVINPDNPTPGLADYFEGQLQSSAYDVNFRMRDEGRPDIRGFFRTHEISLPDVGASATGPVAPPMQPFPVMQDENVQVSSILVDHGIFPSFAFRFETARGTVVFGGDTTPTPNLITLAQGADVLVHEVIDLDYYRAQNLPGDGFAHMSTAHTDVAVVGGVAQAARVKTLVLTHIAPADPKVVPDYSWQRRAQQGFTGRVMVGHDLERVSLA